MNKAIQPVLVIDIGGTKLAAGIMTPDNAIIYRRERPTLASQGAEIVLDHIIGLGQDVLTDYHQLMLPALVAVGVASAGQIDSETGDVIYATDNLPGWMGLPLGKKLAQAFAMPVFVENDVNCFGLAESVLGAGRPYRHILLIVVGTGLGGSLIINDRLYSGWLGGAGKVGHICFRPDQGQPCTCGLSGCLESYTATRIIVANSGFDTIQTLGDYYRAGGDVPCVDEAATWLGYGLASLAHILGPEAILVGGSVSLLGERYLNIVRRAFSAKVMTPYQSTPILATQLEADSGLLGAGIHARNHSE